MLINHCLALALFWPWVEPGHSNLDWRIQALARFQNQTAVETRIRDLLSTEQGEAFVHQGLCEA
jgi:hypothetical protein